MHLYEKTEKALGNLTAGKNENSSKPQDEQAFNRVCKRLGYPLRVAKLRRVLIAVIFMNRLKGIQYSLPKLDAMHDALTISQIMPVAHEGSKLVSKLRLPYDL